MRWDWRKSFLLVTDTTNIFFCLHKSSTLLWDFLYFFLLFSHSQAQFTQQKRMNEWKKSERRVSSEVWDQVLVSLSKQLNEATGNGLKIYVLWGMKKNMKSVCYLLMILFLSFNSQFLSFLFSTIVCRIDFIRCRFFM